MSGGRYNYTQRHIEEIADYIEGVLNRQGKRIPENKQWNSKEWLEEYPESNFYETFPEEIQYEFRQGVRFLRIAYIYAQRIDWLLSGDDGQDNFIFRLNKELEMFWETEMQTELESQTESLYNHVKEELEKRNNGTMLDEEARERLKRAAKDFREKVEARDYYDFVNTSFITKNCEDTQDDNEK